jgi:hypothetical protein
MSAETQIPEAGDSVICTNRNLSIFGERMEIENILSVDLFLPYKMTNGRFLARQEFYIVE